MSWLAKRCEALSPMKVMTLNSAVGKGAVGPLNSAVGKGAVGGFKVGLIQGAPAQGS